MGVNKRQGIRAPEQVTFTVTHTRAGNVWAIRTIRTGLPSIPYYPRDPGRRQRLIEANAQIMRDRRHDPAAA